MTRALAALAIGLLSAPALATPLEKAASLLSQEELVRGEAQYALEGNGDRRVACRLYRQAYQLGGDAFLAYTSEQTAAVQYKSVFALKEHCADLYPEFQKSNPLPER
jgi:hypothetical protein